MSTIEQVCWLLFRLTISFDEAMTSGVACNINSLGFHVLCKATEEVVGHVKPYSITGTLPLIRELQVLFSSLSHLSLRTCLCKEISPRSKDFCFNGREESRIPILPKEIEILSIVENQFSFFLLCKNIV